MGVDAKPAKVGARVQAYALEADRDPFDAARKLFTMTLDWLCGDSSVDLTHADLEAQTRIRR